MTTWVEKLPICHTSTSIFRSARKMVKCSLGYELRLFTYEWHCSLDVTRYRPILEIFLNANLEVSKFYSSIHEDYII